MSYRRTLGLPVAATVLVAALIALLGGAWFARREAEQAEVRRLRAAVLALAPAAAELLDRPAAVADAAVRRWATASGLRVTLIAADGVVRADSWTVLEQLGRLENHGRRPEVLAARRDGVGVARRRSATTHNRTIYVAALVGPAASPAGTVRLAIERTPAPLPWAEMLLASVVAGLAGLYTARAGRRSQRAVARHLTVWSDLPADGELAALAEDADRHFRRQREALERELDAARVALAETADGVILLDRTGTVCFVNDAAVALLGERLAAGRELVEAVRSPELLAAVAAVGESGQARHTAVTRADGGELEVSVRPLAHATLAVAIVVRDVGGERRLERARRALVADLAHELRTPLTVLGGLAEELETGGIEGEALATLGRQVDRLRVFAADLEELAAVESGRLVLEPERVEATAVVRGVLSELGGRARSAGVALEQRGEKVELVVDSVRLAQVIGNLVDNAIRYNRPGGRVTVTVEGAEDGLQLTVEDDGLGIPAAEIPFVFQRFYRVHRGPSGGSGLGLAIVKHLVRALGGTVHLASEEGRGTTVTVTVPASASPLDRSP